MINKKRLIPTLVLALTVSATVTAEEPNDQRSVDRQDSSQHQNSPRLKTKRIFKVLDSDENRIITLDEFLAKPLAKASLQFDCIDSDDDGLISLEEFLAAHGRTDDIDTDAVRACIAERQETDLPERPDRESRFAEIDTNGDGFIDLGEFETAKVSGATDRFNRIDSDADGGITPQELFAALISHHQHRKVRRECIEEQREMDELLGV